MKQVRIAQVALRLRGVWIPSFPLKLTWGQSGQLIARVCIYGEVR
jgi:hypothetical protein